MLEAKDSSRVLLKYLIDTATGIEYIHRMGIIHRDIKPSNIMLKNSCAAISDFGVACWHHFVRAYGGNTVSFKTIDPQGTPEYMAPEVQQEKVEYTRACDLYSFGVVILHAFFFEMVRHGVFEDLKKDLPQKIKDPYLRNVGYALLI